VTDLDVILVGPYPPPFGGISAHIARVAEAIQADGMTVGVLNHFRRGEDHPLILGDLRRNPLRYWHALRQVEARVVHYHHARWSTLMATALALRVSSAAKIATVHGHELEPFLDSRIPGIARMTRWALGTFDLLIGVSVEVAQVLQTVVDRPLTVIPAYIPALDDQATLSPRAESFMRDGVCLLAASYRLTVDRRGRTTYGLETAIESFEAVACARPELRLAIFLAQPPRSRREADRLRGLVERVRDERIRSRIAVFYDEPLTPALRLAALYLRPTLTDGDAVSIREAIAAGVHVLASDVVGRPDGVTSLPLDSSRWAAAIDCALQAHRPAPAGRDGGDPRPQMIAIYDRLIQARPKRCHNMVRSATC
jgi:glycosyltransferase involved in cell wall biosynthesis